MRILHLFSNWKWTGPAELAVNLCQRLSERHDLVMIPGIPRDRRLESEVAQHCEKRGVPMLRALGLSKHLDPLRNMKDLFILRRMVKEERFDLIHCHLPNDHLLAGLACLGMGGKPVLVRSFYGPSGPEQNFRARWLLNRFTRGAIVITAAAKERLVEEFAFPETRSRIIPPGVDTERFDAERFDRSAARERFGFKTGDFVFGIVARMQRHRKFEVLLEAMKQAMEKDARVRLLIVGRGTHREEVAIGPVREMGLEKKILFPGYLEGDGFVEALATMDAAIFLVPGSDGSCRAVREKMAMGLPVLAARTPPLDEMIVHKKHGLLADLTVEGLREGILEMAADPVGTRRMGEEAKALGQGAFSIREQSMQVDAFYRDLVGAV